MASDPPAHAEGFYSDGPSPIKARSVSDGIGTTRDVTPCVTSDPPAHAEGFYGNAPACVTRCFPGLAKTCTHVYNTPMSHPPRPQFVPEPLAFFLTWTTYGSWLPGDARGWVNDRGLTRPPNARLARHAVHVMRSHAVELTTPQRQTVEQAIVEQCAFREWTLHAVSCRTSHVHVVVSADGRSPDRVMGGLKAWCSRRLSDGLQGTGFWWTKGGSMRRLYDTRGIEAVVTYVVECQDQPRG